MKFRYYAETNSLYIELYEKSGAEVREVAPGVVLDFDAEGGLVGIDIDRASSVVNLSRLDVESLPLANVSLTQT
jgi:uncharacterized protein YuzE